MSRYDHNSFHIEQHNGSKCVYRMETLCQVSFSRESKHLKYDLILTHNHVHNSICSLWETTQTLFWAVFGLVDLDSFELDGIKIFTRFWGMLMFGCYSVINIVVLLNLLIAMMNHSYQLISVRNMLISTRLTGVNKIHK